MMRIDPATLTTLGDPSAPATPISRRAARIRQTLQAGLYTVDLDRLAGKIVDGRR